MRSLIFLVGLLFLGASCQKEEIIPQDESDRNTFLSTFLLDGDQLTGSGFLEFSSGGYLLCNKYVTTITQQNIDIYVEPTIILRINSVGGEEWRKSLSEHYSFQAAVEVENGEFILGGQKDGQLCLSRFTNGGYLLWDKMIPIEKAYYSDLQFHQGKLYGLYRKNDNGVREEKLVCLDPQTGAILQSMTLSNQASQGFSRFTIAPNGALATIGTYTSPGTEKKALALLVFGKNGIVQLNQTIDLEGQVLGKDVVITPEGDFLLMGARELPDPYRYFPVVVKLSATGSILWQREFPQSDGKRVKLTDKGHYIAYFGVRHENGPLAEGVYLTRLDSDTGEEIWQTSYPVTPSGKDDSFLITQDGGMAVGIHEHDMFHLLKTNSRGEL